MLTPISAGAICATGGTRVDVGIDTNENGQLDPSEIQQTADVCNGESGNAGNGGGTGSGGAAPDAGTGTGGGAGGSPGSDGGSGPDAGPAHDAGPFMFTLNVTTSNGFVSSIVDCGNNNTFFPNMTGDCLGTDCSGELSVITLPRMTGCTLFVTISATHGLQAILYSVTGNLPVDCEHVPALSGGPVDEVLCVGSLN